MRTVFEWKRFWCPRGKSISLSDDGYLYDPESQFGNYENPALVAFDVLREKPCLALLGEPGIGKSWALRTEVEDQKQWVTQTGAQSMWIDLRGYSSEDRLFNATFGSEAFKAWRDGDYMLYMLLDSFDECLLRIDNVATLLADQLPSEPTNRLRLRIACRTAPWPAALEKGLSAVFGDGFEVFELAPLRKRDVAQALRQYAVTSGDDFFARVKALDITPFAIKPITLNFLIDTYRRDGNLPSSQSELYEKGCRILCDESNESRRASGRDGHLSVDQRLALASRIAAITHFCNRYAVSLQPEGDLIAPEDMSIADLISADGSEPWESVKAIKEVLDTGLFSSRGLGRVGWAHQTYSEFLAARFCLNQQIPTNQLRGLLLHPHDRGQRVVPQLYDLTSWICISREDVLKIVAGSNPEILLGVAGASLPEQHRRLVVQELLNQSDGGRHLNLRWNFFHLYPKLQHSGLAEQLRPFIVDQNKEVRTRQLAIDIAHACKLESLGAELANIALDVNSSNDVRIPAGAAAADVGCRNVRARLLPLATGTSGEDPDDELKGIGLRALWPDLSSAKELFSLLTRPKNRNLHGAYTSFLYSLGSTIKPSDLPIALNWFVECPQRDMGPLDALMDDIIHAAWSNLELPAIKEAVAVAILSRVRLHDRVVSSHDKNDFANRWLTDAERRKVVLQRLLPQVGDLEVFYLQYAGTPFVPDDLVWLVGGLQSGELKNLQDIVLKVILRTANRYDEKHLQLLWYACQKDDFLRGALETFFYIRLDSEYSKQLRQSFDLEQRPAKKLLEPPPQVRVNQNLVDSENGDPQAWLSLVINLTLTPDSEMWQYPDSPDLTTLPGWSSADSQTRKRIVSAASRYVLDGDPENREWFGTRNIRFSAMAGYQALHLLASVAPPSFSAVSADSWAKWVPIILKFPNARMRDSTVHLQIVQAASLHASETVSSCLLQLVDSDNEDSGYLFTRDQLNFFWDDHLAAALLGKISQNSLKPRIKGALLQCLLEHRSPGARESALALLNTPPSAHDESSEILLATIEALITSTDDAAWSDVWPVISDFPEFGKQLINSITYAGGGYAAFLHKLKEEDLATLYCWMLTHYPPSPEDHKVSGVVGPAHTAVMFRDHILEHLKKRGTAPACEGIIHVMEAFPQYAWLGYHLDEAETIARAATWQPLTPTEFSALVRNRDRRTVENGEQLLEVLIESLDRLQTKMQDELPAAVDLWSSPLKPLQPKYEEDLSDKIARHLRDDLRASGVVVNREVQIKRIPKQRTDIHVDAIVRGGEGGIYDHLVAIIEVKADWNAELKTAMETQLRDGYLRNARCKYGLYLVGRFYCDNWDDNDYRKAVCPRASLEELRNFFSNQAIQLSTSAYKLKSYILDVSVG